MVRGSSGSSRRYLFRGSWTDSSLANIVINLLREFPWDRYGVAYAVLFGSIAKGLERPRDVDVAISCLDKRCRGDVVLDLYADLSKLLELRTHLPLDIAVLDWAPPCGLVIEVFRNGVLVYEALPGLYVDDMVRRVLVCYDWSVVERKLRILETVEKVAFGENPAIGCRDLSTALRSSMEVLDRLYRVVLEYTSSIPRIAKPEELDDIVKWLAMLHVLQIQSQAVIDMVMRFAPLLGFAPSTPMEAIEHLTRESVLTRDEAMFLRKVVGFRNIVIHEYQAVNRAIVAKILSEREYLELAKLAKKLIEEAKRRNLDP